MKRIKKMNSNIKNVEEVFEEILANVDNKVSLTQITAKFMNSLLNKEREIYL